MKYMLQKRIREYEQQLEEYETLSKRRWKAADRPSSQSGSDLEREPKGLREIKFKDIDNFTLDFKWIRDLEQSFKANPRHYLNSKRKVYAGIAHLNIECRQRWYTYCDELNPEEAYEAKKSWDYFKDWTNQLVANLATGLIEYRIRLESARQKPD
ncbi:hypothetical protein N7495_006321 [Penicillium taxi]|uniref:uncharacterized protein n=1 Tax=Penicillium taxi TaxID=168475 RepID=UPI002545B088|nr:uncharacterized protein N7495_006321 [Penicillium taxi]KAJ5894630.1 hypothetical protein N7495_006321 [Penicillium taxi]